MRSTLKRRELNGKSDMRSKKKWAATTMELRNNNLSTHKTTTGMKRAKSCPSQNSRRRILNLNNNSSLSSSNKVLTKSNRKGKSPNNPKRLSRKFPARKISPRLYLLKS